jgi:hypothetical protein
MYKKRILFSTKTTTSPHTTSEKQAHSTERSGGYIIPKANQQKKTGRLTEKASAPNKIPKPNMLFISPTARHYGKEFSLSPVGQTSGSLAHHIRRREFRNNHARERLNS